MKLLLALGAVLLALPSIVLAVDCPLPDTGQTKCYNNSVEITCPSPDEDFYGQDAQYGSNLQSFTKLDASGNDLPDNAPWPWTMVRDNVTGLIWEVKQDKDSIQNYNNPHDADNAYYWSNSIGDGTGTEDFINALNQEEFGGYSDWRLPTVKELSSIIDISKPFPSINTDYFPNTMADYYWSSTTRAYNPSYYAWSVAFVNGYVDYSSRYDLYLVRAVRGGQCGSLSNYIDNGDGTVTDSDTGLMWQKDTPPGTCTWQQALSYCENLSLAAYDDWRLPDVNELQSLVDYNRFSPAIDTSFFPNTHGYYYRSSTTYASNPNQPRVVDFYDGGVDYLSNSYSFYVRAVRGGQCGSLGDSDGDTVCDNADNCIDNYNPAQEDQDADGIGDVCDSCPRQPNSPILGICVGAFGLRGKTCVSNEECGSGGICCMNQSCASGCDCKSNFDCDYDVDGTDASRFKADFGRSLFHNPCIGQDTCNGDFECDGDVDGTDASDFKRYFGVSPLGGYCISCVDGVYQFSCSY